MKSISFKNYRLLELFLLFFIIPVLLALPISKFIKITTVLCAVFYVGILLYRKKKWDSIKVIFKSYKITWKRIFIIALVLLISGGLLTSFLYPKLLFKPILEKPIQWFIILFVYSFLSVIPQELVYRKFFFDRYKLLFKDEKLFLFLNAICFSLCHLFLKNTWVLLITFIGGLFFTYTYTKTQNIWLVSIEHSFYGLIIFTLGLGEALAFPS